MVHAVSNNGVVSLESVVKITEGQLDKIKAYPKEVKRALKDLHVSHIYAKTEDGEITSKMGMNTTGTDDILEDVEKLKNLHEKFIAWVDAELTIEAHFNATKDIREEIKKQISFEANPLKLVEKDVNEFIHKMADNSLFVAVILNNRPTNDICYAGNMPVKIATRICILTSIDNAVSE